MLLLQHSGESELSKSSRVADKATDRMNRMYRWQRYIYDSSRSYYLLGRDRLIADLQSGSGAKVLEIGCGTGRNLIEAARRYPKATFFGLDVSTEMLSSARSAVARKNLADRVHVAHGDATAFDPDMLFGVSAFETVFISYSLSMIPEWPRVLGLAASCVERGGRLQIVDFGANERLPRAFGTLMRKWLAMFDVTPRHDLQEELARIAAAFNARLTFERPYRGYAQYALITFPPG